MEQPTACSVYVTERCVRVTGEIDLSSSPSMIDEVLKSAIAELDLSGVTFMDSSGLHALLTLQRERQALRIVAVSPPVQRLLDITQTQELLLAADVPTASAE